MIRLSSPVVAAALAACISCQHDPLQGIDADATAAAVLDFGQVEVGQRKALPLTVTNTGVVSLAVKDAHAAAPFGVDSLPGLIDTGTGGDVHVSFAPGSVGQFDETLTLMLSSMKTPSLTVRLKGSGAAGSPGGNGNDGGTDAGTDGGTTDGGTDGGTGPATMVVEPLGLAFSAQLPNAPAAQEFRVHNTGGAPLHFSLQLSLAPQLSVAPTGGTLAAGAVAQVSVSVTSVPASPTAYSQTITVTSQETASQDVAVAVQFTGAGGPPPPPPQYGGSVWPKFHQGNTCTGLSSVTTNTRGHVRFKAQFGPARQTTSNGTYVGSPTLAEDGTVYQQGGDGTSGTITAFEPLHGGVRWSTPITSVAARAPSIEGTPTVVASGAIFVMTGSENRSVTHFYKLGHDGNIIWSDPGGYADGFDSSPALGSDGTLYLAYDEGPAVLFFSQGIGVVAKPQEIARVVLSGLNQGRLESQSSAIADDGTAYWTSNGQLLVMNKSGPLWSHDATGDGGGSLSIGSRSAPMLTPDGKVIFAYADMDSVGNAITVITAVTAGASGGHRLWQRTLGPTFAAVTIGPSSNTALAQRVGLSSPALGPDGTIYIGHADGLYALDPSSGAPNWHAGAAAVASSAAVGADGTVFFGAMDGTLTAAGPDGHVRWTVPTNGQVNSSPAVGADGAVFVASDDGYLYAVE